MMNNESDTLLLKRVLVVDDEESIRIMLRGMLKKYGYNIELAANSNEALGKIESFKPDIVLVDVRMPDIDGISLVKKITKERNDIIFFIMTAYGSLEVALEAIRAGAYDYLTKPFKGEEILLALRKVEERERLKRENIYLRQKMLEADKFEGIIAHSQSMKNIFLTIQKIADYRTTVLITGESGTGKELVAKAIHMRGKWSHKPFVAINCGAIPENLLESELFGYKRGAFTDARIDKKGLFEEADNGTIFLDEIGELPLNLQVKLLRVLQENCIRRLGDTKDIKIEVRVIAATARDLAEEVRKQRFRQDLFYRLNVLSIFIPPLRERTEDIEPLISYFISKNNKKLIKQIKGFSKQAKKMLLRYPWPGNVRELENIIERSMVLADGDYIELDDLPEKISENQDTVQQYLKKGELSIKKTTSFIEEELIKKALEKTNKNRTAAAKLLEISHRALLYKIKEYNIKI